MRPDKMNGLKNLYDAAIGDYYTIYFMRGDTRHVFAKSESDAFRECVQLHPETTSWDVLKIEVDLK